MSRTELGKAFEYACLRALHDTYAVNQDVIIVENEPLMTAMAKFELAGQKQNDLMSGAYAAVRILNQLEPRLAFSDRADPLYLSLQTDAQGQHGDVRDVLCVRHGDEWEIGLSCKHNHTAVKHSRLSSSIDFGMKWFGVPCSQEYFDNINPVFEELDGLRSKGREQGRLICFRDFADVDEKFYLPVLNAFMAELERLCNEHAGIPAKLVHYLMGQYDFYKIITDDFHRVTKVEPVNINGTLNRNYGEHRSKLSVPIVKLPTEVFKIRMKEDSKTTVEVICDNSWSITMRIHSAKKEVEPSLKFDVNLTGMPEGSCILLEAWD